MNIIIIYEKKRILFRIFRVLFGWGILLLAFYFNYKFIGGNNFLDIIIMFVAIFRFVVINSIKNDNCYKDVPLEKIEEIEAILRGKQ